ncbi:MAG: VWA domain-containing protein [Ignavibacteria bacterium]|nr:VWA domain-containing protein [Ignavibacteria bacterium]
MSWRKYFSRYRYRENWDDDLYNSYYNYHYSSLYNFDYYSRYFEMVEGVLMNAKEYKSTIMRAIERTLKYLSDSVERLRSLNDKGKISDDTFMDKEREISNYIRILQSVKYNFEEQQVSDSDILEMIKFTNDDKQTKVHSEVGKIVKVLSVLYVDLLAYLFDERAEIRDLSTEPLFLRYLLLNAMSSYKELIDSDRDLYTMLLTLAIMWASTFNYHDSDKNGSAVDTYEGIMMTEKPDDSQSNSSGKKKRRKKKQNQEEDVDKNNMKPGKDFRDIDTRYLREIINEAVSSLLDYKKLDELFRRETYEEYKREIKRSKIFRDVKDQVKHVVSQFLSNTELCLTYSHNPPVMLDIETILRILDGDYEDIDFGRRVFDRLVLMIDVSGSVDEDKRKAMRVFVTALMEEGVYIDKVILFNTDIVRKYDNAKEYLLRDDRTEGGTNILNTLVKVGRDYKDNILILTDLEDDPIKIDDELYKRMGIVFFNYKEHAKYVPEKWQEMYGDRIVKSIILEDNNS